MSFFLLVHVGLQNWSDCDTSFVDNRLSMRFRCDAGLCKGVFRAGQVAREAKIIRGICTLLLEAKLLAQDRQNHLPEMFSLNRRGSNQSSKVIRYAVVLTSNILLAI